MANPPAPTTAEPVIWAVGNTKQGHYLGLRIFSLSERKDVKVKVTKIEPSDRSDVRLAPAVSVQSMPLSTSSPPESWEAPWIWSYQCFFGSGITKAEVTVEADGATFWGPREISLGVSADKTSAEVSVQAPRLSAAINTTEQVQPASVSVISAGLLNDLLRHIWSRLEHPMDPAWLGPDGTRGLPPDMDDAFIADPWGLPEEAWAQGYTQMFFGVPYLMPGTFHLGKDNDNDIFKKMQSSDPAHPLTLACQQMCTTAAITRGVNITGGGIESAMYRFPGKDPTTPENGASVVNPNEHTFNAFKGTWYLPGQTVPNVTWPDGKVNDLVVPTPPATDEQKISVAAVAPLLEPGCMFMYANDPPTTFPTNPKTGKFGASRSTAPHIAFAIRKRPSHVQFFDTSAIQPASRDKADQDQFPATGNLDYKLIRSVSVTKKSNMLFRGVGVLPKPTQSELAAKVAWMRTVRPLGAARLVIHEVSGDKKSRTLLMTPLLRMHSKNLCFPISKYLWSLRNIPGASLVRAEWWIYGYRGDLAAKIIASDTRTMTLSQMVSTFGVALQADAGKPKVTLGPLVLASSSASGLVSIPSGSGRDFAFLPASTPPASTPQPAWGTFWLASDLESQRAAICANLPDYYTQDW